MLPGQSLTYMPNPKLPFYLKPCSFLDQKLQERPQLETLWPVELMENLLTSTNFARAKDLRVKMMKLLPLSSSNI